MKRIKGFWEFIKSTIGKWVLSLFGSIFLSLIMMFVCDCTVLQGFFASLSSGFVTGIILLLYSNHKEHCIKKCSQKAKDINKAQLQIACKLAKVLSIRPEELLEDDEEQ